MKGFALISAIFILIVLSVVGVYIVSIASLTQTTTNYSLLGARVFFAAKSGLELGTAALSANGYTACPSTITMNFSTAQVGLNGIALTVTCTSTTFTEGTSNYNLFTLLSSANINTFGNLDYVSRNITTQVTIGT
ncbi:MAG: pilus assembly protein MshP [Francisellaceae bacterium]|nr:pilus assembly protein MshP [Francisellaceae bacterium]